MDRFIEIVTYFALISVAAERFTDLIKKAWLSKLTTVNPAVYQLLSALFGAAIAYAEPLALLSKQMPWYAVVVVSGLAVSGGSSFWNTVLSTLSEVKTRVSLTNANLK